MEHDIILRRRWATGGFRAHLSRNWVLYFIGISSWITSLGLYAAYGFSAAVFAFWLFSLLLIGASLYQVGQESIKVNKKDLRNLALLLIALAPLYLLALEWIPNQVTKDEISLMVYGARQLERPLDLFGVSDYFGMPAAMLLGTASLGNLLGGITLENMRMVHATMGLVIVGLAYFFLRVSMARQYALAGAIVLGTNHALLGISRLAQWDNLALLAELLALVVLLMAVRIRSMFLSFVGGALAGLTFYVYFPSRITYVIWLATLLTVALFLRPKINRRSLLSLGLISAVGFIMVTSPVLQAGSKYSHLAGADYYRAQLLIFPEGRERNQDWVFANSALEGVWINISRGLTTFNNLEYDRGFIYENRGHGFVDPLTGVLLWSGVAIAIYRLRREKSRRIGDLLALVGFGMLLLVFSFITTQAPNYTRLLITLPFVAYLVVVGLRGLTQLLAGVFGGRSAVATKALFWGGIGIIAAWNLNSYAEYVENGFAKGDLTGTTARYVAARSELPNYSFLMIANLAHPYYKWGEEYQWVQWFGYFAGETQSVAVLSAENCLDGRCRPPFAAFMSLDQWELIRPPMQALFPDLEVHPMLPSGDRVAVEVRS